MDGADRLIEVFNEAKARSAGPERDGFLALACRDDAELKIQVVSLLQAHEGAGEFLGAGPALSPEIEAELARLKPEEVGERIGPYKLREQIGEGGFGVVWVAEQQEPVRRTVALKIIKMGMDTKEVVARFEQERQALAMMDHPNIARVFDAGATEHGRPFFVMELVRGIKITDYCDQANLPTAERLQLFIAVCQAVQHAHQKGIIHRDLKPSNILVTLHDGVPVPKVIDFGVAKATQRQRLTDLTIYTQFEQMIGTPLYMSPEQAERSGLDVDTRSDIYSLGVLLYELLTGRTPFDPEELMRQGLDEIRRIIREQEPQTPSIFVRTLSLDTRTSVAQHRQTDGAKLAGLIRGDLDWIVMKALEKDRARRYETANDFSRDIQRHLENEPVLARPPSQLYRLGRLIRRNRVVFAAGAVVTAALLVGLSAVSGLGWVAWHERQLRNAAETELALARKRFANDPLFSDGKGSADQGDVASKKTGVLPPATSTQQAIPVTDVLPPPPSAQRATPTPGAPKSASTTPLAAPALKARVATAQKLEEEGKWAPALDSWLKIAQDFPESGVGRNHLESLLNQLRSGPSRITPENFTEMREQIKEAAERGILSAMLLLGDNLRQTEPKTALRWYSAASAKGNAYALTQRGLLLANAVGDEKPDFTSAVQSLQAAADKGDTSAKYLLAESYLTNHGLPAKDVQRAVELAQEAADAGDSRAMNLLGDCYAHGTGVKQDFSRAFGLFSRASAMGNMQALGNLGVLYMTGRGVAANPKKGAEQFEKGARAGDVMCMFYFAQCLEEGLGVAKDVTEARAWFIKAARAGNSRAADWCRTHNIPLAKG